MPQHQILEGIEDARPHGLHVSILRKEQWQLLLEHQHARGNRRHDVVAGIDHGFQLRDVALLQLRDLFKIPQLEQGHAAAALLGNQAHGNAVVLEERDQVGCKLRLIAIAVAGGKERNLAARFRRRLHVGGACAGDGIALRRQAVARGARVKHGHRRVAVHSGQLLQQHPPAARAIDRVHGLRDHRDPGKHADSIGRRQHAVAQRQALFTRARCLGAQHQMREIDIPRVRRDVRALRHEAHVAEVAVIDDLPVDLAIDAVELAARGGVYGIEQRRKGVAEAETAPAAMADVKDAAEFGRQGRGVVESRAAPVERMARGRLEAAFALAFDRFSHAKACIDHAPGRNRAAGGSNGFLAP